jgi:hypothetical protein
MLLACLILILSTAFLFFYLQSACQKILRQRFEHRYFESVVYANRLEFPAVREGLGAYNAPADYSQLRTMLKCDFLALTYLLKHAANFEQSYSLEERLLILYCRLTFLSLRLRHLLSFRLRPAILRLTDILQYFANLVGQRVEVIRFENPAFSDYRN